MGPNECADKVDVIRPIIIGSALKCSIVPPLRLYMYVKSGRNSLNRLPLYLYIIYLWLGEGEAAPSVSNSERERWLTSTLISLNQLSDYRQQISLLKIKILSIIHILTGQNYPSNRLRYYVTKLEDFWDFQHFFQFLIILLELSTKIDLHYRSHRITVYQSNNFLNACVYIIEEVSYFEFIEVPQYQVISNSDIILHMMESSAISEINF